MNLWPVSSGYFETGNGRFVSEDGRTIGPSTGLEQAECYLVTPTIIFSNRFGHSLEMMMEIRQRGPRTDRSFGSRAAGAPASRRDVPEAEWRNGSQGQQQACSFSRLLNQSILGCPEDAVTPPSTGKMAPVTKRASSEARKSIGPAMSSATA